MSNDIFERVNFLGKIFEMDLNTARINVKNLKNLEKVCVGDLLLVKQGTDSIISIIEKISFSEASFEEFYEEGDQFLKNEVAVKSGIINIIMIGSIINLQFERSITRPPNINAECYILPDAIFQSIFVAKENESNQFEIGTYCCTGGSVMIDGNKFFQRHAAILGSTGSGKSWCVATLLEKAASLNSSNIVVMDIHGEYKTLDYASSLIIPGPNDLNDSSPKMLFLPYWLLNASELIAMFIDKSEYTAQNQVSVFQAAILRQKRNFIKAIDKNSPLLESLTLNSPIPFSIEEVINELEEKNVEMEQGSKGGLKQGKHYGTFSKLLSRINNKIKDKRYGFLFSSTYFTLESITEIAEKILSIKNSKVKTINFSEVPSEILPMIIGLIARIIFEVQFWTNDDLRKPIAIIADECHVYLPSKINQNPTNMRSILPFEKISKEGRKFGIGLVVISQRPSDVSETILTQANNVISLRLSNPKDQAAVQKMLPDSLAGITQNLPLLKTGEAIIIGDSVAIPTRINLNIPICKPTSSTIDFWSEWRNPVTDVDFASTVDNMRRQSRGEK